MDTINAAEFHVIGKPLRRKEDDRLLRGQGRFSDDFNPSDQTFAVMVRSPYPHARIRSIDVEEARAMPGVLGVFTGADCAADGLQAFPHEPVPKTKYDTKLNAPGGGKVFIGPHVMLPADKARHVGEAIVMVVGETRGQALDAAELVVVDYEELPWVAQSEAALEPGAPAIWDQLPGNLLIDTEFGDKAATDRAFAEAAHVARMDFHIGRVTAVTMEPRAALGQYDPVTGRYTLHAGSGGAVRQKAEVASALGVPPEQLRILAYDVGGNFGARNRPYVEFVLVCWAARRVGRPVKFTATRSETMLSDYQGRDLVSKIALAIDKDGRFLALRADNISNVGARCVSLSPLSKGSGLVTGSYDIPVAYLRSRAVFTNTMSTNAYRSSGRPEVTFAIERLIDAAARDFGFDRVELRRKNLVVPEAMPYQNAVGTVYDSGTYEANMDLAIRISDWGGFAERRKEAESRGKLLGLGLAHYVESSIGSAKERTEITVTPKRRVNVVIGTQPSGQGHETSFAQVVSDLLAIPVETVALIMGDTDIVSVGGGSHSGRSMRHAATVIKKASVELIQRGKEITAFILDTTADQVTFTGGRFIAPNSNLSFDFLELAEEAAKHTLPAPLAAGLAVGLTNEMHEPVFPNGCTSCEIEIDPDTGALEIKRYAAVDDVGRCINPMIVHGQTHGGIAQGVGQALWEQCYIDPESGQPLCGSLMDYGMPHADHFPSFRTEIVEVLSPTNPLGIKAGGEGGTTPALAVILSAIIDALSPYGIRDIDMPVTSLAIWQAIQEAKRRPSAAQSGPA